MPRISSIVASEIKAKQKLMQKQDSENLLDSSINIDEKKIMDLDSPKQKNQVNQKRVRFKLDYQEDIPYKQKSDENVWVDFAEKLNIEDYKKAIKEPQSARKLQDSTYKIQNTLLDGSNNKKSKPSFALHLDAERLKALRSQDNSKNNIKLKKDERTELNKSDRNIGRLSDTNSNLSSKSYNLGRLTSQRVSADQIDHSLSKNSHSHSDFLKQIKHPRQDSENSSKWTELFKKAANRKK